MACAHAIVGAYVAIEQANTALKRAGMTPAKVPSKDIRFAKRLAFAEPVVCLREPAQRLINLIAGRAAVLAQEEALRAELDANDTWGMF